MGVKMKRRSLWKGTHFKPALLGLALNPGYHGLGGIPSFPTAGLAVPGAKKDASGKIPACESGLPRFLEVVHVRPAPGAGTPKFWSAALLRL